MFLSLAPSKPIFSSTTHCRPEITESRRLLQTAMSPRPKIATAPPLPPPSSHPTLPRPAGIDRSPSHTRQPPYPHIERERKVGGGVGKDGSQITACREGGLTGRRMGKIGQRRSEWSRARGTRWCKRRPREQDSRGGPRRNVVELVARAGRGNADRRRRQPRSMEVGVGGGIGWGRVDGRERRVRLGIDKW